MKLSLLPLVWAVLLSGCMTPEYTARGMASACDKIVDWSERKVCLQKVDRYEEDRQRSKIQQR